MPRRPHRPLRPRDPIKAAWEVFQEAIGEKPREPHTAPPLQREPIDNPEANGNKP